MFKDTSAEWLLENIKNYNCITDNMQYYLAEFVFADFLADLVPVYG